MNLTQETQTHTHTHTHTQQALLCLLLPLRPHLEGYSQGFPPHHLRHLVTSCQCTLTTRLSHTCIHTYICTHTYSCIICISPSVLGSGMLIYLFMYECMNLCVCACIYVHIHTHTHTHSPMEWCGPSPSPSPPWYARGAPPTYDARSEEARACFENAALEESSTRQGIL